MDFLLLITKLLPKSKRILIAIRQSEKASEEPLEKLTFCEGAKAKVSFATGKSFKSAEQSRDERAPFSNLKAKNTDVCRPESSTSFTI